MPDVETLLRGLEGHGYRRTGPRRRLLAAIARRTAPFTAAELGAAVQDEDPGIGRATVFRTLDLLAELGLIQRLADETGAGGMSYLACGPEHHHHLICTGCGRVDDFTDSALESRIAESAGQHAFVLQDHRVDLYGVCADCRQPEAHP